MTNSTTLSVSVLNVLLNLLVIVLVAIGAEIAQYGIYKSTQLQLKRRGTAPFVTEADDIFSHFKNRVSTARRSRNIVNLIFVVVSASLIFGEICSEVGVDASFRCDPRVINTVGLCAEPFDIAMSDSRVVAHAYHTKLAEWDNHELQSFPIYEGFRKNFNGRESFTHTPSSESQRIVVAGCATSTAKRIEPYEVTLTISQSMNVWRTYVSQAITPNGSQPLTGFGDFTTNGKTLSAFLIVPSPEGSLHARVRMLEYHSKTQLFQVMNQYFLNRSNGDIVMRNEEYMVSYNVWCKEFPQSAEQFAKALQIYRSVQLEDTEYTVQNISIDGRTDITIPLMNGSDVVRAAITLASMNTKSCAGETFEYTECGIYHWQFLAPLLILFGLVVIFAVFNSLMVMVEDADIDIPYSSSAWSAVALHHISQKEEELQGPSTPGNEIRASRMQCMSKATNRGFYQLVDGEDGRQEVVFRFESPKHKQEEEEVSEHKSDQDFERQPSKQEMRAMLQANAVVLTIYFAAIRATPWALDFGYAAYKHYFD